MPPARVTITNLQATLPCDADRILRAVRAALRGAVQQSVQINVAIVDDATIHGLNRRHLQHDYPTDVLSYPLEVSQHKLVGEIVVSAETAHRQASEYGWSGEDELCLYVVHGALHLAGFSDKTRSQKRDMRAAEQRVLSELGIVAPQSGAPIPRKDTGPQRRASRSRNRHAQEVPSRARLAERDAYEGERKSRQ